MQIIGCQTDIIWENKAANHDHVRDLLSSRPIEPGALVLLPEMFATGFSMHVDTIAETAGGETQTFLAELAARFRCHVLGGVVTRAADGRGRNEAVVCGPDGREVARYCKLHPFSYAGETKYYQAGENNVLFACHDFQVAPFVCYDLRFPEIFRRAVRRGAQLLIVIANWPEPREAHWLALLRARAIENQAYVVGVNRAGSDPHAHYGGHSLVVGPRGETLAEGDASEQLVAAEIELPPLLEYRSQFPALADMRAEFFAE